MGVDLKRRKAVMARSMRLGHCVCDPRRPCPCDVFKDRNVCQCAGERLPAPRGPVELTRLVHKAGCASKIGQADLLRILGRLPVIDDPNVLVGAAAGDDAGVYRLANGYRLVQTVDVFTPCVDDPYLFGQIVAANSVSDIYAMGGRPLTALSVAGFPIEDLDGSILEAILRGGIDKLAEAGCVVIGGHSMNDPEIKCGFAVTGLIDEGAPVTRDAARPGDALVLTKPLGSGILAFAAQIGRIGAAALNAAGTWMACLNKDAAELMVRYEAHACTDVTGFGLAGHLVQMARGSKVIAEVDLSRTPVFAGVLECLRADAAPGAIERNQEYAGAWVRNEDSEDGGLPILYDPQTSGGLLIALPEPRAEALVEELRARGNPAAAVIGRIRAAAPDECGACVVITRTKLQNIIGDKEAPSPMSHPDTRRAPAGDAACCAGPAEAECCASPPGPEAMGAEADALALFTDFLKAANAPGRIDARAKKLMAIALSVVQRCEPCLRIHMESGRAMGLSMDEIDEAAQLAIAFGGCAALMFYKGVKSTLAAQD